MPVLGFYQESNLFYYLIEAENHGRIAVFGDSSCLDEANQLKGKENLF